MFLSQIVRFEPFSIIFFYILHLFMNIFTISNLKSLFYHWSWVFNLRKEFESLDNPKLQVTFMHHLSYLSDEEDYKNKNIQFHLVECDENMTVDDEMKKP